MSVKRRPVLGPGATRLRRVRARAWAVRGLRDVGTINFFCFKPCRIGGACSPHSASVEHCPGGRRYQLFVGLLGLPLHGPGRRRTRKSADIREFGHSQPPECPQCLVLFEYVYHPTGDRLKLVPHTDRRPQVATYKTVTKGPNAHSGRCRALADALHASPVVTRAANSCRDGGGCPPAPASNEHCPEDRRRQDVVGALALVAPGVDTRNDRGCTCQRGRGCRALVCVGRAGLFRSSSMQTRVPRALDLTFMATRSSLCRTAAGLLRAWQYHYEGTETSLCVPARQVLAC